MVPHFLIAKMKKLDPGPFQPGISSISKSHLIEGMGKNHLLKLGDLHCINGNLVVILEPQGLYSCSFFPGFLCQAEGCERKIGGRPSAEGSPCVRRTEAFSCPFRPTGVCMGRAGTQATEPGLEGLICLSLLLPSLLGSMVIVKRTWTLEPGRTGSESYCYSH